MDVFTYVTGDMVTEDVVQKYPEAAIALIECGMGCVSCPASAGESLEQAAMVHGLDPEEVVNYVNQRMTELGVAPEGIQMNWE